MTGDRVDDRVPPHGGRRALRTAVLMAALVAAAGGVSGAWAGVGGRSGQPDSEENCALTMPDLLDPTYPLSRAAARFAAKKSLSVVVIGSASSLGKGVSSPARAYPAQLGPHLAALLHGRVTVTNRAAPGMTARLAADRMAAELQATHPDLVVWEAGTTDVVKGVDPGEFGEALMAGLQELDRQGVDTIFVDSQFSLQTSAMFNFTRYLEILHREAEAADTPVFPRWEIMRGYSEDGRFDPTVTAAADQYRNADFVHGCLARLLARQIAEAMKPRS